MQSIEHIISHRPPFRFLDEAISTHDEGGRFALNLLGDDPRCRDGLFPSLLLIEAMAQAAAAFEGARRSASGRSAPSESGMLVGMDRVELLGTARSGDRVEVQVRCLRWRSRLGRFEAVAKIGDLVLARALLTVFGEAAR